MKITKALFLSLLLSSILLVGCNKAEEVADIVVEPVVNAEPVLVEITEAEMIKLIEAEEAEEAEVAVEGNEGVEDAEEAIVDVEEGDEATE